MQPERVATKRRWRPVMFVCRRRTPQLPKSSSHRRETERQLVDHEQAGRSDQHPGQGEHSLLAAGERAGDLLAALAEPREQLVGAFETCGDSPRPRLRRKSRVRFSSTVSELNTERPSGAYAMPSGAMCHGGTPVMLFPSNSSRPAVTGSSPEMTRAIVVLPAPLPPSSASNLALVHRERDTEQCAERAVGGSTSCSSSSGVSARAVSESDVRRLACRRRLLGVLDVLGSDLRELAEVGAPNGVVGHRFACRALRDHRAEVEDVQATRERRTMSMSCSTRRIAVPCSRGRPGGCDELRGLVGRGRRGLVEQQEVGWVMSARPTRRGGPGRG